MDVCMYKRWHCIRMHVTSRKAAVIGFCSASPPSHKKGSRHQVIIHSHDNHLFHQHKKHPSALLLLLFSTQPFYSVPSILSPLIGTSNGRLSSATHFPPSDHCFSPPPPPFGIMSTPSALPVNAGDPQPNDSAPATTPAENVKTATTSATPAPETPAQSADKPQAQPQQPKQAIDDDDDDDESDLDELDGKC